MRKEDLAQNDEETASMEGGVLLSDHDSVRGGLVVNPANHWDAES